MKDLKILDARLNDIRTMNFKPKSKNQITPHPSLSTTKIKIIPTQSTFYMY